VTAATGGVSIKLSGLPASLRMEAPAIGQDSVSILRELGYSDADIGQLVT
jgi:crotonobetainyl-CoA:carnitine CoA-transferase CaiB-like acyl-CoA transferase